MIVPVAVLAALVSPSTSTVVLGQGGVQVRDVVAEPSVVLSGSPVEVRGLVQNLTMTPVVLVVGTAVSTDLAPGMTWSESKGRDVGRAAALLPGQALAPHSTFTFVGDGWVRVGLIASGDTGIIPPAVRRVLVVDPKLSATELMTLVSALVALAMGAVLIGRAYESEARCNAEFARRRVAGVLLIAVGAAAWIAAAALLRTLPADVVRNFAYAGLFAFVVGWTIAFGKSCTNRMAPVVTGLTSYLLLGTTWMLLFHVWEGFRPSAVLTSVDAWLQAVMWPLMVSQVLLGLRFA